MPQQTVYINQAIHKGWVDHEMQPSPLAPENEWCRRVYLDILGRIPTVRELDAYLSDKSAHRKRDLVDKLLSSTTVNPDNGGSYVQEYARNWTNIWMTILIGRPPAAKVNNDPTNREAMAQYLRRSFQINKPYDQFVVELVTATGSNTPEEDSRGNKYNPAVNYLTGKMDDNGVQATAKTAQIFLGLQVQCTQCHNHPFNDWKQNQFWELNAFFRQTKAKRNGTRKMVESFELVDENYKGESYKHGGGNMDQADLFYELRNGVLKVAYPVFVDGTEIDKSGDIHKINRRKQLGDLIRNSDYMNKAIVNRMWGHFFGYGFTKPVDDLGPHNQPTHPELLERLANDFRDQSHDLKQLIRWIVLSDAYSLSAKFNNSNRMDDPTLGERPAFSHFYLRQMRSEELYESLLAATEADKTRGSEDDQQKMRDDWLKQFTIAFGTDENDDVTTFNGTIPQALMMMNGDLIKKAISIEPGSFLHTVAASSSAPADKINAIYMAALARRPNGNEISRANAILMHKKGDVVGALQDVFWAVLNSNEFIIQH
ncbi:MAG TPA: DUF1549 domain-containing protein [Pirellulales bacterium]|nr:DUF1549 domain-containing protein [Pirellulales bacterium]